MPDVSYPSIPDPNLDPGALLNTVNRLKETVELMTGQTKDHRFSFPNQVKIVERRSGAALARFTTQLQIQANTIQSVVISTTTLEADLLDVEASVVAEQTARATADSALASSITTVTARANGATANGQIYLQAEAAPAGYGASFGWTLQATSQTFGMKALVDGTGLGSIAFTANRFKLMDPSYLGGAPVDVFNYNGVTFNFGVDVTIRNQEIGANAVSNVGAASGTVAPGGRVGVPLTVRAGASVVIIAMVTDVSGTLYLAPFSAAFPSRVFNVDYDGAVYAALTTGDMVVANQYLGGSAYAFYKTVCPTTQVFNLVGLAAGVHDFGITNGAAGGCGLAIVAIEHSK